MAADPNRPDFTPKPGALHGVAASSAALARPRLPLPMPRRGAPAPDLPLLRILAWGAAASMVVAVMFPAFAGLVWFLLLAMFGVAAVTLLAREPCVDRPAQIFLLCFGGLLATVLIAAWLGYDQVGVRVLLFLPWPVVGALLCRAVGTGVPRLLLWVPAWLVLAALLLWASLLLTLQFRPVEGSPWQQWHVFAGWPWPHYLGAVRGNGLPAAERVEAALWLDYAVMLGIAAALLARCPTPWLVRWLPRLCGLLALAHLLGGYRLAFATDG